jgi:ribose transport system substrate-binding protein
MKTRYATMVRGMLIASLLLAAIGCSANSADRPSGTAADSRATSQGTIGVSLLTLTNPFFQVIGDNIKQEAQKHGYQTTVLSADEDVVKQGNQVKDFIVSGVAAIVLSPCQVEAIGPIIREANDAGIPVFTVDIPCRLPDVEIVCQIASDNYGGGRQAAAAMIEALEGSGKVAILHYAQAESCQLRVKGFQDAIREHNDAGGAQIEITAVLEGGGAKDRGAKATEDLLQSTPDIAGIFAINDPSALGALSALERAGKADQVILIGFDGQPDGKRAIKAGKIYGDPVQYPDQMGVEVVRAIVKHSKGEDLRPEHLIPTTFYRQSDALQDPELQ